MQTQIVRAAAGQIVSRELARRKIVDIRGGIALLRSREVPFRYKLASVALGIVAMVVVQALEIPVETVIAALLGPLGLGFDMVLDGTEAIVLPALFAAAILPHLAPKP